MSKILMQPWRKLFVNFLCLYLSYALLSHVSFAGSSAEGIQVYQKNLHGSAERKQKLADDIMRYRNADNLWDILREEFVLPHYEDNPDVQAKIEWFMNNQDYLLRSASRAAPYLYYILQQVRKRHLPAELVLLPIIESGYNPFNRSPVGAAGIWQLMPDTASGLGIRQDWWYDGRRDVIASTRAALNHLAYLQNFFEGNWLLAFAAYDTGEGNVLTAIRRNIRNGKSTDFWSLPLAQETKDYVPQILALATIISRPDQYPIYFPPVQNAPYLAEVNAGRQINLKYAASLAGISFKKLTQLNPGFNRSSTSPNRPARLVLPIENVEQFIENLARSPWNPRINWAHYKVKSGDTLSIIANKFNTTSTAIRNMNHLSSNRLKSGINLLIPLEEIAQNVSKKNSDKTFVISNKNRPEDVAAIYNNLETIATNYSLQPGDTIYVVRKQDSLAAIAQRFHVTEKSLQAANQLQSNKLKVGKQIIIPTHAVSEKTNSFAINKLYPGDTLYMVRRGDSIEKIANKFRTTSAAIRVANLLETNSLQEGDRLIIPTHIGS